jgi:hypothetical protein
VNGAITASSTITSSIDQQQVNYSFSFSVCLIRNKKVVGIYRREEKGEEEWDVSSIYSAFFSLVFLSLLCIHYIICALYIKEEKSLVNMNRTISRRYPQRSNLGDSMIEKMGEKREENSSYSLFVDLVYRCVYALRIEECF